MQQNIIAHRATLDTIKHDRVQNTITQDAIKHDCAQSIATPDVTKHNCVQNMIECAHNNTRRNKT
jgi:hypothetical protein